MQYLGMNMNFSRPMSLLFNVLSLLRESSQEQHTSRDDGVERGKNIHRTKYVRKTQLDSGLIPALQNVDNLGNVMNSCRKGD